MESRVNIGELDTLVEVQSATLRQGAQGNKKVDYAYYGKVWAKVERNITEMVGNGNLEEGNMLEVTCYKIPELTVRWRIVIGGIAYEVVSIDPISRISPVNILSLKAID